MDFLQIIILAIVQGITEFLPVSSSAHLILVPLLTEWQDQGLAIDVAAHFGSLFAVILYFRTDVYQLLVAGLHSCKTRAVVNSEEKLFWLLVIATFPVLLIGFIGHDAISNYLRDPLLIAGASIVFGLLLLYADRTAKHNLQMQNLTLKSAIIIGLAQAVALIPGTSRSGITMTAGLMLGLHRQAAARFSFLMAIPVILCAAAYESLNLFKIDASIDLPGFALTVVFSAVSALLTIHYFLRFLERIGMLPFVIYRVLLGILLIVIFA